MTMLRLLLAFVFLFLAALPAHAQQDAFTGTWAVVKAEDAPWLKGRAELKPDYSPELKKARIIIGPGRLKAPLGIGCLNPRYTVITLAPDTIFEGGLDDPDHGLNDAKGLAAKLGITAGQIPTLENSCSEQQFHLADSETIVFARNNVIYTMKKRGPH